MRAAFLAMSAKRSKLVICDRDSTMKKLPVYALLLSLGVFAIGCEADEPEPVPATTPATDTTTDTDTP